eukprot:3310780-Prymnesium_polylepis.1
MRRPVQTYSTDRTLYTLMRHARLDRYTRRDAACEGGGRGDAARAPSGGDEAAGDAARPCCR